MNNPAEEIIKRLKDAKAVEKLWDELVPAAKYSIIFAGIFILSIWLVAFLNLDFPDFFLAVKNLGLYQSIFIAALLLLINPFFVLSCERLWVNLKIIWYKQSYPLKKLNKDFYIISFKGRVCLLDILKKEIKWIKSWQTAIDLDFVGEWTNVDVDITNPSTLSTKTNYTTKDGYDFKLSDFKYVPGIHTQGVPGT